ncbi:MAG: cation:proton antiporter [bacterium]
MAPAAVSPEIGILTDLVITMAVALGTIYVAHRFRIPSIVSFLIAGMIIGPSSFRLIREPHQIEIMAEIGVVLLLFTIGLEFSLSRLVRLKKYLLLEGGLQILCTTAVVAGIALSLGFRVNRAVFFGFLASLSSTAIVMKLYADRGEVNALYGNAAVGVLLFQDLCIVPMMLLVPLLGMNTEKGPLSVVMVIVKSILAIGAIILTARLLFPWIMERIVAIRIRESFTLTIILLCLGTAWLTSKIGASLALGAFLAGLILSESEYSSQAISEIIPMTDSFTGLFFISIGMLLDLAFVYRNLWKVLSLAAIIIALKAVILFLVVLMVRRNLRIALIVGLGLSQIGEFSFILAQAGIRYGLMSTTLYQYFLDSSILSMLVSPLLIHYAPGLALAIQGLLARRFPRKVHEEGFSCSMKGHTLVIGYGLNGRNLARVLKETGIPYQIVDLNAVNVRQGKEQGQPIVFGDATRRQILSRLAIDCAKIAVVAISDPSATRRIVWQIRRMNPSIYIIARTRFVAEVEELYRIGADQVIPEEFETSVEIFSHVLHQYRVPRNIINLHVNTIRDAGYSMLRGSSLPDERFESIQRIIAMSITETFLVTPDSPAVGKTLADLQLRSRTGVTVMGIIRADRSITNPAATMEINAEDILIMFGSHEQLDTAVELLSPPRARA